MFHRLYTNYQPTESNASNAGLLIPLHTEDHGTYKFTVNVFAIFSYTVIFITFCVVLAFYFISQHLIDIIIFHHTKQFHRIFRSSNSASFCMLMGRSYDRSIF